MILDAITRALRPQAQAITTSHQLMEHIGRGYETVSGLYVNDAIALRLSAVNACVRLISTSVAALPLKLYQWKGEGHKGVSREHALYPLLHDAPNALQTAVSYWTTVMMHLLLRGNSYSLIVRDGMGRIAELIPLHPDTVTVDVQADRTRRYKVSPQFGHGGPQRTFEQRDIFHIMWLSTDGVVGRNPIQDMREQVGAALGAERYGNAYFRNGATVSMTVEVPQELKPESAARLEKTFTEKYGGASSPNLHGVAVLESGAKLNVVQLNNRDAQFIESRRFSIEEIARIFGVPLHLIQENSKSTSWGTGIEQLSLGFVTYTLRPWLSTIEQAVGQQLLSSKDRSGYFAEFVLDAILRGDAKTRAEVQSRMYERSALNADEWRANENLPPLANGEGQVYVRMGNLAPVSEPAQGVRRGQVPSAA